MKWSTMHIFNEANLYVIELVKRYEDNKSMGWCKKDVTPLLTHKGNVSLALTHRNIFATFGNVPREKIRMWESLWTHLASLSPTHLHDDVIKWGHFARYWPFVRGIHWSPVNSPHKGQWRGALMFSLICAWINDWVNNGEAGNVRRHRANYEVTAMWATTIPRNPLYYDCGVKRGP